MAVTPAVACGGGNARAAGAAHTDGVDAAAVRASRAADTPENIARKILTANGKNSAMQRQKLLDAIAWSRSKDEMIRSGEDDSIKSSNAIDQSSCIVDAGISKSRFGWIDLSAGPFAYGPTIGGSGVPSSSTEP